MDTVIMKSTIPACKSKVFAFETMFRVVLASFVSQVTLPMSLFSPTKKAQKSLMNQGTQAINLAVELVVQGHDDEKAMKMIAIQIDCQEGFENFLRYDYEYMDFREVAIHEMFLHYMKIVTEIVELTALWRNTNNSENAKMKLAEITTLMVNCFVLMKFSFNPSNFIDHNTLPRLMSLMRFQAIGVESLDASIQGEFEAIKDQHKVQGNHMEEARRLFFLYHETFMAPLKKRLENIYYAEVSKYN
jgi:hypothetical protein